MTSTSQSQEVDNALFNFPATRSGQCFVAQTRTAIRVFAFLPLLHFSTLIKASNLSGRILLNKQASSTVQMSARSNSDSSWSNTILNHGVVASWDIVASWDTDCSSTDIFFATILCLVFQRSINPDVTIHEVSPSSFNSKPLCFHH